MSAADLQSRVQQLAATDAARKATARDANRSAHPEFAAFVDAMRAAFGDVRVRWIRYPDGREQGTRL